MDLLTLIQARDLSKPVTFLPTRQGYFNETSIVDTHAGRYVLRMYLNGGDLTRLRHEQALMTPDPGDTAQGHEMGRALGELVEALAALPADSGAFAAPTYGELHRAHPEVPQPEVLSDLLPAEESNRQQVGAMIDRLMAEISGLYERLPRQLTHGDFVTANVLTGWGRVTGVFDFEFSAYDLRAMDLAIALGGGPHALRRRLADWDVLESISRGYFSRSRLTP